MSSGTYSPAGERTDATPPRDGDGVPSVVPALTLLAKARIEEFWRQVYLQTLALSVDAEQLPMREAVQRACHFAREVANQAVRDFSDVSVKLTRG